MSAPSGPKRLLAVGGAVAAAVLVSWWLWPSGGDGPDGNADSSAARHSDNAGGSGTDARESVTFTMDSMQSEGEVRREAAEERTLARGEVSRFLRASSRALRSTDGDRVTPAASATGSALDAARAAAAEFEDNGWHQVGTARILSASIVADQRSGSPPRMTVRACVDSSDVDVVDETGRSVRTGSYATRSSMLFDLVRRDGTWLVERQTFPDDPDC